MSVAALARPARVKHTLKAGRGPVRVVSAGRRAALPVRRANGAWGMRRPRNEQERETASQFQRIRAVLAAPDFWQAAAQLPGSGEPGLRRPGRPASHPSWVLLLAAVVTAITGSQRSAVATLADPIVWRFLCDVTDDSGYRKGLHLARLGPTPIARHHLKYFQRMWASAQYRPHAEAARAAALGVAGALSGQLGLLDPDQPLDYDCMDRTQWLAFDGTIFTPASRTRRTAGTAGAVRGSRIDTAAARHVVAGRKAKVYGSKYVFASVRADDFHERFIVDVQHVAGDTKNGIGDEAAVTMMMARRLASRFPGARGLIVDSVLRGKHITDLAAEGLLVLNYPHALRNPKGRTEGRMAAGRVEKSTKVHVYTHTYESDAGVECSCQHDIYVYGTVYHQLGYDAAGQQITVTLDVINLVQRKNADGTYRWYHQLKVPCVHGDQTVLIALFHNPRKKSGGIHIPNRGEYLRAFPVNTIQFSYGYGRRNDTESLHHEIKKLLPKMPAYGAAAQSLYVLGMVIAHNSLTRAQLLRRTGLANALDGT